MSNLFENRIQGLETFSMMDFPGNLSAILFYGGCNFRCPYCYNCDVVDNALNPMNPEFIIDFAQKRKGKLDGFVISGGECTIHGDNLIKDIEYLRSMGYKIKVDSNGSNVNVIQKLIDDKLVDYFAIDMKTYNFAKLTEFTGKNNISIFNNWMKTIQLIQDNNIPFEIRTTVHTDILDENGIESCIKLLRNDLNYQGVYYIQNFFTEAPRTLCDVSKNPRILDIEKIKQISKENNIKVEFRNFK